MPNDKELTKLISKSLHGSLSDLEAREVDEVLKSDDNARAFAEMSKIIQRSVAGLGSLAEQGEESLVPGLSDEAKKRLSQSVSLAMALAKSDANQSETRRIESNDELAADSQSLHEAGNTSSVLADRGERTLNSRFALIRKIGEGGLGSVWLARDEKLKRNVAIKEMNLDALQSEKAWLRFSREAEITGHLEHPNVVPLYQYGTDPQSGEPFYAMRFVGKRTLADAIEEHYERCDTAFCDPLGLHRLLSAFLDVCQAIAYAHSRGVIHRDLKPENVALDSFGQVIVLDWGLAKLAEDGELGSQLSGMEHLSESTLMQTMAGEVIGTPLYMAPEQASGDLDSIDSQTDVYGLGGILFSILTGSAPHSNVSIDDNSQLNVKSVLKAIAENETPVPSSIRIVPKDLEAICLKAMSRKKYGRHESASELAAAVETWVVDQGSKKARYESLRMEGRELRGNVQAAVRDLETNTRFMSSLPPIQEIIALDRDGKEAAQYEDDLAVWRERLASIYSGLLSSKSDYRSVVFCKLEDNEFTEIVRCSRHSTDLANVRKIPKSRLRSAEATAFMLRVADQHPEEVRTSLACNPLCDASFPIHESAQMVAGVPVFDELTEELFGFVLIECNIDGILRNELRRRFTASDVIIGCDTFHVLLHANSEKGIVEDHTGVPLKEGCPKFETAIETLQTKLEYIDDQDREIYGARLWLVPNEHGIMFMLSQK
jgi:serine/threonine protein kinase